MEMDGRLRGIINILKKKGYKITSAREEIIKVFLDNYKHMEVKDIHELLKGKVSLSTIYRTIDILKKNDIIKEINIKDAKLYELKIFSGQCIHIHLQCIICGSLIDIYSPSIAMRIIEMINKLEDANSYVIKDSSFIFQGICNRCKGEVKSCHDL